MLINDDEMGKLIESVSFINASFIGGDRYIYFDEDVESWFVVTKDDLIYLYDCMKDEDPQISDNVYSHWCAGTNPVLATQDQISLIKR